MAASWVNMHHLHEEQASRIRCSAVLPDLVENRMLVLQGVTPVLHSFALHRKGIVKKRGQRAEIQQGDTCKCFVSTNLCQELHHNNITCLMLFRDLQNGLGSEQNPNKAFFTMKSCKLHIRLGCQQ